MITLVQRLYSKYSLLVRALFFLLLFGVLSFGRAFSVIHIEIHSFPIFITEIVLFISLPLIIIKRRELLTIPSPFLNVTLVYFLFGYFYLLNGVLDQNLFALRDFILLSGYLLFLPLAFICFKSLKSVKLFFHIIVFANLIAIVIGKLLLFGTHYFWLYGFISKAKTFQIGIVYGMSSAFLLIFYNYLKNKAIRFFILLLVPINLYMLIMFGERSLWLATICLAIFLMLILGFRVMVRVYLKLLVSFFLIGSVLFYINFVVLKSPHLNVLIGKSKSLTRIFTGLSSKPLILNKDDKLTLRGESERIGYDNIIWRSKVWSQTIEFTSGSYLFGKGFGRYPAYDVWGHQPRSAFTDSNITPAHNYFLTIFYKLGFFGLALFLFINIYIFYYTIRYLKNSNSEFIKLVLVGALGALVFWHAMAMFFDVIDSPPTSIFLWIFNGLILAMIELDKQETVISK